MSAGRIILPTTAYSAVFVLPDDTDEHDVIEIPSVNSKVFDFAIRFDLSEITKTNFKLRLYSKVDGINYRIHTISILAVADEIGQFVEIAMSETLKITAQSNLTEGATRNLPYRWTRVWR